MHVQDNRPGKVTDPGPRETPDVPATPPDEPKPPPVQDPPAEPVEPPYVVQPTDPHPPAERGEASTMHDPQKGRTMTGDRKERRGFASMSPEKQREIASKGGRAAHQKGTAHEWTSEEARSAGRKGGQISRGGRGRLVEPGAPDSHPDTAVPPSEPEAFESSR
jgi:uncharacterized protein